MSRQITMPCHAPSCTLQIVHDDQGQFVYAYSVALYARAASSKSAQITQLVYAPADMLEVTEVGKDRFTLWARTDGNLHVCFEITAEAAAAIAEFIDAAAPAQQVAA